MRIRYRKKGLEVEYGEKILSIEKFENINKGDGFNILTTRQVITFFISNNRSCCENWGMLISEDDPNSFIGATLRTITRTTTALITHEKLDTLDEGGTMFINVETSRGTFQMAAYNSHNGYYGHSVDFESTQLACDDVI